MPTAALTGQRIRAGTYTASGVPASYGVELLAIQSDQDLYTPWTINRRKSTPVTLARVVKNADLTQRGDGYIHGVWRFDYMTFGMMYYWLGQFLPGLSFLTGGQSAPVTIMDYDQFNTALFVQCNMYIPQGLTTQVAGWSDVDWQYDGGVITT